MEKYKRNPIIIFIYATMELASLIAIGVGTLIVLILSGIFLGSLHIRNFFRKRFGKYNKSK
jgi:uncharacterized membrane protein SpoIIM required for sporulation